MTRPTLTCCLCGATQPAPAHVKAYKRARVTARCGACGVTGPHGTGER